MWVTEIACSDWQSPERLSAEARGNPFSFPVLRALGAQEVILVFLYYRSKTLGLSQALALDMT